MLERQKENIKKLSKQQILYVIEQYQHLQFGISEILVDASKVHMTPEAALERIRKCLIEHSINFLSESLSADINFKRGEISPEEYREILLGGERMVMNEL